MIGGNLGSLLYGDVSVMYILTDFYQNPGIQELQSSLMAIVKNDINGQELFSNFFRVLSVVP